MKSILATIGAFATLALAQDISGLPQCGQICATSMWGAAKAEELGCSANDLVCLCKNKNFLFGIRDCSAATCSSDDARKMVEFGLQACRDVGVQITDGGNQSGTSAANPSASSDTNQSGASASTIFSTVTTGSGTVVAPVSTTTFGNSASNTAVAPGTNGGLVSTVTSGESTFVVTLSTDSTAAASETESGSGSSQATDGTTATEGAASSTESGGAAMPQQTLAPAAILGAGLAALLL
uniref:CFEM domain-containing protein n=1 Tax=Bionectria ochroleuca TaxID=29856 RepID=A0A8H7NKW8_BIOOC